MQKLLTEIPNVSMTNSWPSRRFNGSEYGGSGKKAERIAVRDYQKCHSGGLRADPRQSALVVVDVQMGMFAGSDPVYQGQALLNNIGELLERARIAQVPIIYVQHDGADGSALARGSAGWAIHPAIAPEATDIVVEKTTPDAFYGTALHQVLRDCGVGRIVLCGIQSDVCIDTTCRRAFSLEYKVTLIADGHSTWQRAGVSAKQVIAFENDVLKWFAEIVNAHDIHWP